MRPLLQKDIQQFLERFDNFKESEIRSLDVISPTTLTLTLTAQDAARGFDWISVEFEFNGVEDAKIVQESQLDFLDMSEGISLLFEENLFAFGVGECYNIAAVKNSACYIVSKGLKYQEGAF